MPGGTSTKMPKASTTWWSSRKRSSLSKRTKIEGNSMRSNCFAGSRILLSATLSESARCRTRTTAFSRIVYAGCGLEIFAVRGLCASLFYCSRAIQRFAYLSPRTPRNHRRWAELVTRNTAILLVAVITLRGSAALSKQACLDDQGTGTNKSQLRRQRLKDLGYFTSSQPAPACKSRPQNCMRILHTECGARRSQKFLSCNYNPRLYVWVTRYGAFSYKIHQAVLSREIIPSD